MMGHNGSYQPDLDPLDCLAALAIRCLYTGLIGIISIAEKTDLHTSQQETTAELLKIVKQHIFVGVVDCFFSLVQFGTKLLLIDHTKFLRPLFYQLILHQFAALPRLKLSTPIDLRGVLFKAMEIEMEYDYFTAIVRCVHVIVGVAWIGLLYYFNFVQVPALKNANADGTASGITKHVAPLALLWFRWAALATWIAGAALLGANFVPAFTLSGGYEAIGLGSWLGTIMLFNVWVLIWPNQQKILGLKPASDSEKTSARRIAFLASRTNTMLSIPMLFLMTNGLSHKGLIGL